MTSDIQSAGHPAINESVILKYNQPAPRYTSYPTALKFCTIDDDASREAMCLDAADDTPLSLYVHLPFCRSLCWFCGCTKIISTNQSLADTYLDYLEKEIALVRPHLGEERNVVQIHFGGGTPNFLDPKQINRLGQALRNAFDVDENAEISVEIDPRTLTEDKVAAFRQLGVNRASIGVQDVNPEVQIAIHRIQSSDMNRQSIEWLRNAGIKQLNVDLIYGLPNQSVDSFSDTLEEVIGYDPDRFALFSYAHVPWSQPAQKILEKRALPTADEKIAMLVHSVNHFVDAGYHHIGMDHFTKPDDPLAIAQRAKTLQRNFQGYSLYKDAQICGFGMSAISQTHRTYKQNFKELDSYYEYLDDGRCPVEKGYLMSLEDQLRRQVIMRLMCDMELEFDTLNRDLDIDFRKRFQKELAAMKKLVADGLVELTADRLVVTSLGRLLVRSIARVFDAYATSEEKRFSKAV